MKTKHLVSALLALPLVSSAALTSGLVAYYDFEDLDTAPGTTGPALSASGTGHALGVAGGRVGGAAEFSGTTNNVLTTAIGFGGGGSNQLGNSFTVSAWYNLDTDASSAASRFFVFEGSTDYDISYGLRALDGDSIYNDSQTYTNGATDFFANHTDVHTPGEWQHVLMTYQSDGTDTLISTYIDGGLASTVNQLTAELSSAGFNIGNARGNALTRAFDGKIDEFATWDRVLDGSEINQVRQLGLAGQAIPEPSVALLAGACSVLLLSRRRRA